MNLLALETTSDYCSVALSCNGEILQRHEYVPKKHAQVLLDWITQILNQAALQAAQLDCLAYSCGPGSYTGIRISAAVLQAIALAYNIPLLAIPSLQVAAQGVYRRENIEKIIVIEDAKMHQLYYGQYALDKKSHIMMAQADDLLLELIDLLSLQVGSIWNIATNATALKEMQDFILRLDLIKRVTSIELYAQDVITLALHSGPGAHKLAQEAMPIYLRNKDAWKKQK